MAAGLDVYAGKIMPPAAGCTTNVEVVIRHQDRDDEEIAIGSAGSIIRRLASWQLGSC